MSAIQVAVRARPLSQRELSLESQFGMEMSGQSTTLYRTPSSFSRKGQGPVARSSAKEFRFDHSYWSVNASDEHYATQEQVYSDLGLPVIQAAFAGYNSCVFAYGQTGSGKTYTMTGYDTEVGLIPRICGGLYSLIERGVEGKCVSFKTEVSYMEIYNEKVRDLLSEGGGGARQSLRVREHPREGPYVEGLSRHVVTDYPGIAALLEEGSAKRVTASTKMNDSSSRSHAIFTLIMTQAVFECGLPSETRSKLHLVDLAGSERASATGAEGERLKEGGSINRSLVCLGSVISALADKAAHHGNKNPYIPYRDSILTYLLKDSLGGNAKTIMIATVSPADSSYGETLSTLRYASRAKAIINKPVVNEDASVKVIRELRVEIGRLKTIITTQHLEDEVPEKRSKSKVALVEDIHKKEEKVAELTKEWASKWKDIQQIIEAHHVALHSEGAKMVVQSEQPHLVGIDPDILSTGLVFYYLKGDGTTVGSLHASPPADIVVSGLDIAEHHCRLVVQRGNMVLQPRDGACYINRCRITSPSRLRQGDLLQLGGSAVFRFNHPQEAKRLRKRHSEGLLDPRRLASRRNRKRIRSQGSSPTSPDPAPPGPAPQPEQSVTVMELQSRAVVRATGLGSTAASSLTLPGVQQSQQSQGSCLPLTYEDRLEGKEEKWSVLPLVKIAMSPLTLLTTAISPPLTLLTKAISPLSLVRTAVASQGPETALSQDHSCEVQRVARWRRWLYALLLLCNAPVLLMLLGALTLPAFSMLAVLLSSVKVFGVFQRFWPFRWLATLLALTTAVIVAPVAGLCDLVFRIGFSVLAALRLLPSPSSHLPLHGVRQPG